MNEKIIEIIQPDDWHTHLREGDILKTVLKFSSRINNRCIAMPNLHNPITSSSLAIKYIHEIKKNFTSKEFTPLIPFYLTDNMDLIDFDKGLKNEIFVGAKLYPQNSTNNSSNGVTKLENIFPALEILEKRDKVLLIHGEKVDKNIDIFDREKYFIDDELTNIRKKFSNLRIVLEHVSSKYGADFVAQNKKMGGTITPQHMLLTKKDIYFNDVIDPFSYCMPIVKEEEDLICLRKYACSGHKNFFLGTDSAPHDIKNKNLNGIVKPGIFTSPASLELYAEIFDQENSINKLETFSSINGPNFYNLPLNTNKIKIAKKSWYLEEFTQENNIKIKNFFGGKKLNWKVIQ